MTKLSYSRYGNCNAECLLFVHGIMMNKHVWTRQISYFKEKYQVLAIDLYGFGESEGEFRDSNYEAIITFS